MFYRAILISLLFAVSAQAQVCRIVGNPMPGVTGTTGTTGTSGSNGLVVYLPMNETSGTRYDASGNGYNFTDSHNSTTYVAGMVGNAAWFPASPPSGSGLESATTVVAAPSVTSITVACWIKTTTTADCPIIMQGGTTQWTCYLNYPSRGNLAMEGGSTGGWHTTSGLTVNDGSWHHAVFIFSPSALKIWCDGILKLNATGSYVVNVASSAYGAKLRIGQRAGQDANFPSVALDEFKIWNRALSDAEVLAL